MNIKNSIDKNTVKFSIGNFANKYGVVFALFIIVLIFSLITPYFFSIKNFYGIGLTLSVVGTIAIGQTLCILIRGFDLSVGQIAAFAGISSALMAKNGMPYLLVLLITLLFGLAAGALNGFLIAKLKINALITTLSFMTIYLGLVYIVSKGYSVTVSDKVFSIIGTTRIFGTVPLPIIILAVLYLIFFIILKYATFGRYIYCLGGNPEATRISGININMVTIVVYTCSGLLAAIAGIILSSRLGAAQTTAGGSYALDSVAAVVLGGTVLSGGKGGVLGSLMGVAIIGVLQNGLIMVNMPIYYQFVATGLVLLVAVLMQQINDIRAKR